MPTLNAVHEICTPCKTACKIARSGELLFCGDELWEPGEGQRRPQSMLTLCNRFAPTWRFLCCAFGTTPGRAQHVADCHLPARVNACAAVGGLNQLLSNARASGRRALQELGQQELHGPNRSFFLPEGLSWETVIQLASSLLGQQQQKLLLLQAPAGSVPAAPSHTPSAELQVALSAAVVAAAAVGHHSWDGRVEEEESAQGASVGLAGSVGPSASEANSLRPASQAEEHVRRLLILGRLRGLQHGTTADDSELQRRQHSSLPCNCIGHVLTSAPCAQSPGW